MPDFSHLLAFAAASAVLVAVPGPAILYLVTRSLADGRRAGVASMLGVEAGTLVHVAAAAAGLSALVASDPGALTALRWAGVAYLLWLAAQAVRHRVAAPPAAAAAGTAAGATSASPARAFLEGLTVEVLNPKTALFFVAFLPQFVDVGHGSAALQVLVLGAAFVTIATVCDTAWVLAAAIVRRRVAAGSRTTHTLHATSAGIYVLLAGAAAAL